MIDIMGLNLENRTALLSSLSFDHPLTNVELNNLIHTLSVPSNLTQIYFKDDIDIDSIEKIKLLLEGLPNVDDSKIEKYIMIRLDDHKKKCLDDMNFSNISTWNIAYSIDDNKYSITSLAKYRLLNKWLNDIVDEVGNLSTTMDKLCYLYDKVKMLEYNSDGKYERLPEIISDRQANSYGYNLVFKELLSICSIPAKVENYVTAEGDNFVTIVLVNDSENNLSNVYLFDPSSDTIPKSQYKNSLARRMNYNFFAITMDKLKTLKGGIKARGLLQVLSASSDSEYAYYLNRYNKRQVKKESSYIETLFGIDMYSLYLKTVNSTNLDIELMNHIFANRVDTYTNDNSSKDVITKTIMTNYIDRDKELFNRKSVKQMSKKTNHNAGI